MRIANVRGEVRFESVSYRYPDADRDALSALDLVVPAGTSIGLVGSTGSGKSTAAALVSRLAPADRVGSVTGVVGAAGGLGGFFPPLLMGAVYGMTGDYSIGFVLLAVAALLALGYTWLVIRPRVL